jgi:hypothetical protein
MRRYVKMFRLFDNNLTKCLINHTQSHQIGHWSLDIHWELVKGNLVTCSVIILTMLSQPNKVTKQLFVVVTQPQPNFFYKNIRDKCESKKRNKNG